MDYNQLERLVTLFSQSSIDSLELVDDKITLKLQKSGMVHGVQPSAPTQAPAPVLAPPTPQLAPVAPVAEPVSSPALESDSNFVTSPIVGVFYTQSKPGNPPFVKPGDKVSKGQTLCIIEAMKLMNEITADLDVEILEVLVEDGQMVEYGQNLFRIKEI